MLMLVSATGRYKYMDVRLLSIDESQTVRILP